VVGGPGRALGCDEVHIDQRDQGNAVHVRAVIGRAPMIVPAAGVSGRRLARGHILGVMRVTAMGIVGVYPGL